MGRQPLGLLAEPACMSFHFFSSPFGVRLEDTQEAQITSCATIFHLAIVGRICFQFQLRCVLPKLTLCQIGWQVTSQLRQLLLAAKLTRQYLRGTTDISSPTADTPEPQPCAPIRTEKMLVEHTREGCYAWRRLGPRLQYKRAWFFIHSNSHPNGRIFLTGACVAAGIGALPRHCHRSRGGAAQVP